MKNISSNNNESSEENIIKAIIEEKIFSKNHIHSLYILFSNLCTENDFKLTRASLFDLFRQLYPITTVKYEEEKIDLYHLQIDINKDGVITFVDFLLFMYTVIKLTYNELYYKKGINSLSSLSLSNERKFFIDICSSIFSNIINYTDGNNQVNLDNLNPFSYYDLSSKLIPFYKFYCSYKNEINMNNYYNSQKKWNEFNQMMINYTNINFINELQNLLNSQITSEYYKGLSLFKKSIKPLNYINSELLVIFFNKNIFIFLSIILKTNLLNKVLMIFNIINNKQNDNGSFISYEAIYTFLVIIRRIINLFMMLNETFLFCEEKKNNKKYMYHFIKEQINNFNELSVFIGDKILNPLSQNYNYFYEIFSLKNKKSYENGAKIKFLLYQIILMTSRIKLEFFNYFINFTNYFQWLIDDVKNNLNLNNNINNSNMQNNNIDYLTLENVIYNCINIIDIYLKYEKDINDINFIKNLYLKLLFIANNIKDLIFNNNDTINNTNTNLNNISIKSKYFCFLGLLNCIQINNDNINFNININNNDIKEFDNRKFILSIYTEEFKNINKELTLPFSFYLKSLILNNKNILSLISELDIINNLYIYYSTNNNTNLVTFSHFFDFCEVILKKTEPKILINNSNIIYKLIIIFEKIIINDNNINLIQDIEIKNKIIYFFSEISNLNDPCINEKILNIKNIFNIIISYMSNNFYYIEEMNYLNKKNIVFNIYLIEHGLNIMNNILTINSNSVEKILEQINLENIEILTNLFDKISLLWDINDINDIEEEIIKNKFIFNKYKDLPKKNILIQILCLLENISDLKEKLKTSYNNTSEFEKIFDYINDIDINIRLKIKELKINIDNNPIPTLVLYTQTDEEINQNLKSRFVFEIDGLTFNIVKNMIKEGYQAIDIDLTYKKNVNNNIIDRPIKTENDFDIFIQEMIDLYEKKPNKDNMIIVDLHVELKDDNPKVKKKCINCGKEIEIKLNIDKKKLEEINDFTRIENLEKFNKLINEVNENSLCSECEKLILEHAKNQINIENSKNNINNLSGINFNNNNTYQNILANSQILNNSLINNINNNNILSNSLLNGNNINNNNNDLNNNLQGFNNISNINPTTPRRDTSFLTPNLLNTSNFNNTFSSSFSNYKILRTNNFQ